VQKNGRQIAGPVQGWSAIPGFWEGLSTSKSKCQLQKFDALVQLCPGTALATCLESPPGESRMAEPWEWLWTAARPAWLYRPRTSRESWTGEGRGRAGHPRPGGRRIGWRSYPDSSRTGPQARPSPCWSGTGMPTPLPTTCSRTGPDRGMPTTPIR